MKNTISNTDRLDMIEEQGMSVERAVSALDLILEQLSMESYVSDPAMKAEQAQRLIARFPSFLATLEIIRDDLRRTSDEIQKLVSAAAEDE